MYSIYIHVPFCDQKCDYCSFFMIPLDAEQDNNTMIDNYTQSLISQLAQYKAILPINQIKTIHFGGGSPQTLGFANLARIIDYIKDNFDIEYLEELGIELNPYPGEQVLDLIRSLNAKFHDIFRLRYSIGIQTFDDDILKNCSRQHSFNSTILFLRQLPTLKQPNNVFNFDFIAFGKLRQNKNGNIQIRDDRKHKFFNDFINSGFVDSLSIYTLELFPGSPWHSIKNNTTLFGNEDEIYQEFDYLKNQALDSNMKRYEISNFAFAGKPSLHNKIYWSMGDYIGIGSSASSFIKINEKTQTILPELEKLGINIEKGSVAVRFKNNISIKSFLNNDFIDKKSLENLSDKDYLIEKFMLGLRTDEGVSNVEEFDQVLVANYKQLIAEYEENGLLDSTNGLVLTDKGMDLFNQIITEILKDI